MHEINVFDNIAGVFKTEHGILGSFNIGWRMGVGYDTIQVHGTGGSVFANPLEIEVRHGDYNALDMIANCVKSSKRIIGAQVEKQSGEKRPGETYFMEDRAFIDAMRGGRDPLVSGEDGLRVLEVLEAIRESLDDGKVVEIRRHEL